MKIFNDPHAYETIQVETERNFHSYISKDKSEPLVVVIVGACRGVEIQHFLNSFPNIEIHAFEPVPYVFADLKETYNKYPNVFCHEAAVSDMSGVATFHEVTVEGCGSLNKFINDGHNNIAKSYEVEALTLDDAIGSKDIDLLWVDTQGTELNILKGVADLTKVKSMFLEVTMRTGKIAYENNCLFDELQTYLEDTHTVHSIGLDNEGNNGTGNSFWLRRDYND